MTLIGVMAVILRYFSEFGSFRAALRKSSRSLYISSPDEFFLIGLQRVIAGYNTVQHPRHMPVYTVWKLFQRLNSHLTVSVCLSVCLSRCIFSCFCLYLSRIIRLACFHSLSCYNVSSKLSPIRTMRKYGPYIRAVFTGSAYRSLSLWKLRPNGLVRNSKLH